MKGICFLTVSVLLALSFCISASRTVQEDTGSIQFSSIHLWLAKLSAADFSGHQHASKKRIIPAAIRNGDKTTIKTYSFVEGNGDLIINQKEKASANCLTEDHCSKNKVVCSKKCVELQEHDAEKSRGSARCTIKCKKCVPNCYAHCILVWFIC